jgi:hypothetical protein
LAECGDEAKLKSAIVIAANYGKGAVIQLFKIGAKEKQASVVAVDFRADGIIS